MNNELFDFFYSLNFEILTSYFLFNMLNFDNKLSSVLLFFYKQILITDNYYSKLIYKF